MKNTKTTKTTKTIVAVQEILSLSEEFMKQVKEIGNECAFTDCQIEKILKAAEKLKKAYDEI